MTKLEEALARIEDTPVTIHSGGVQITTLDEQLKLCKWLSESSDAAQRWKRPQDVLVAVVRGQEIGIGAGTALAAFYPVSGSLGIMAKFARGLLQPHLAVPIVDTFVMDGQEYEDGDPRLLKVTESPLKDWPSSFGAKVTIRRKGWKESRSAVFTVGDAKAARLWMKKTNSGKDTPWIPYPKRQLLARATSYWFDKHGTDITMGIPLVEELRDRDPIPVSARLAPPAEADPLLAAAGLDTPPTPVELTDHDVEKIHEAISAEDPDDRPLPDPAPDFSLTPPGTCPDCGTEHPPSRVCPK